MGLKQGFTPESLHTPPIILRSCSHHTCICQLHLPFCSTEYSLQAFMTMAGVPVLIVLC